jgi:hypothetical protein
MARAEPGDGEAALRSRVQTEIERAKRLESENAVLNKRLSLCTSENEALSAQVCVP